MSSDCGKHGLEKGCFSPALAQEPDRACPLQEGIRAIRSSRIIMRFGLVVFSPGDSPSPNSLAPYPNRTRLLAVGGMSRNKGDSPVFFLAPQVWKPEPNSRRMLL
jgi:hypothetical protein